MIDHRSQFTDSGIDCFFSALVLVRQIRNQLIDHGGRGDMAGDAVWACVSRTARGRDTGFDWDNSNWGIDQGVNIIDFNHALTVFFFVVSLCPDEYMDNGGWGTSTLSENNAATWFKRAGSLSDVGNRLAGVFLDCDDALNVIDRWDAPHTCHYIDPPYFNTQQSYTHKFTEKDFRVLVEKLKTIQGSFLLSGYDNDIAPSDWERHEFGTIMSASRDKTAAKERKEVVWRVDRSSSITDKHVLGLIDNGIFDCFQSGGPQQMSLFE